MGSNSPPPYTPSPPSPHYSSEVLPGEQTVESARFTSSRRPAGVYRRITDHLTIVLRDQHPGSVYPIYGRGGAIKGDVILNSVTDDLTFVTLKLEGQFVLHASGVPVSTTFFSMVNVLWSASHAQCCPRTIPFEIIFPPSFNDGVVVRALPPTFESTEHRAACFYSLTIELSRPRNFLSFLNGGEAVRVPLLYRPRSRPHLPMLPGDLPFLSTVKSSPEEWHEAMFTLRMSQSSRLAPVDCLLFIPSVRTYALSDTIPFHLQIRGSPASLIPFLEQGQDGHLGGTGQGKGGVIIRVYLFRQCNVRIHGQSAATSCNLGEAKLEPSQSLPSSHHTFQRHPFGKDLDSLDWDGVVKCGEDVTVPSFSTNQVSFKHSIVLSINPRQPLKSPLLGVTHSVPIRLTTDPWSCGTVT